MDEFKILMPKIGESVQEATIVQWFIKEGDYVEEDDLLFEIASDKVDSEIPSPISGIVESILHQVDDIVPVGEIVAVISIGQSNSPSGAEEKSTEEDALNEKQREDLSSLNLKSLSNRFFSPLVKKIAQEEGVLITELESIPGSGQNNRVRKQDILSYIEHRKSKDQSPKKEDKLIRLEEPKLNISASIDSEDQIIQMDRVRRMISEHMVASKRIAPHVTTFVEADVTEMVLWRRKVKDDFQSKYQERLTFMHLFTEAVALALREFPMVNSSVKENQIIVKKNINIGIAVAADDGKLFVPVVKNADHLNLSGLTSKINRLAIAGKKGNLNPDELKNGTFTITNFGSFGNLGGTPIINQPQVAILAVGTIEKKPAVVETSTGDAIVVRHKIMLSLSYDHRVIDGALGGAFLRRIADLFESFNPERSI